MYALILAGGKASRLGMGEKALVRIANRPLISFVFESVLDSGLNPFVIVTSKTPYTINYCRMNDIPWICTKGSGYIEDIREAVMELSIKGPFLTICADLPGIRKEHISSVISRYLKSGLPACSVWTPHSPDITDNRIAGKLNSDPEMPGSPVGLNILRGDMIDSVQEELQVLLDDPLPALNINTPEDLIFAEKLLLARINQV